MMIGIFRDSGSKDEVHYARVKCLQTLIIASLIVLCRVEILATNVA